MGAVAVAVAVGALSLGLVKADVWGWVSAPMLLTAVITVAAVAVLVHRVRTHPAPVMAPRLFRVRSFTVSNITTLLFTSAFSALFLSVALWMQTTAGYGPFQAGLAMLPGPLTVPLFVFLTQRWAGNVAPRFVVFVGLAIFGLGSLMLAAQGGAHYATDILPGWVITGVGIGIAMPTLIGAATAELAPADAATGSAVVNTARQAGYAVGVAGLVAILGSQAALHTGNSFQHGWIFVTALVLISAATALGIRRHHGRLTNEK